MNLPFYIARRYLFAKKSHHAVNIISWISVISIAIGTFALVVVLSAFNGLESLVESLFESFDSDIRIEAKTGKVFSEKKLALEELQQTEGVANYTRVLQETIGITYKDQQTVATLKAVDSTFIQMSLLDSQLVDGHTDLSRNQVDFAILGYGIAANLGLFLNHTPENLTFYAPKRGKIRGMDPRQNVNRRSLAPGGVFYLSPEYDNKYVVSSLEFGRKLLDYDDEISAVEIQVEDEAELQAVQERISRLAGSGFEVKSRYEFNELIYKTNRTEKWVTFLILLFILIIAAFNILSSLSMLIIEKKKDISTLNSLGVNQHQLRRIFFTEGLMINLLGAFTGLVLGVLVCLLQEHVGLLRLEGGIVEYYPVELRIKELIYILITVLIIGFLTSWYPVRRLARVRTSTY